MTRLTCLLIATVGFALLAPGSSAAEDEPAPIPPAPPRLAESADYTRCLDMLAQDPVGASAYAEAWNAAGGGAPALHCRALAEIALGEPAHGAEMLEKAAARSDAPAASKAAVLARAVEAWMMADAPDRAYDAAEQALQLAPDDPDLLIGRATAESAIGRGEDAIEDLERALVLDPNRADALVLRAAARRAENQLAPAVQDVERALLIDPDNPEALLERGILRQRLGDLAGARADWERARSLAPDSGTADLAEQNLALLDAGSDASR